jgi:hypothetical protein
MRARAQVSANFNELIVAKSLAQAYHSVLNACTDGGHVKIDPCMSEAAPSGPLIPVNQSLLDGNEAKYLMECIESEWISSDGSFVRKFEVHHGSISRTPIRHCASERLGRVGHRGQGA